MSSAQSSAESKPSDRAESEVITPHALKGNMGVWRLTALVLAFNAPLGISAGVVPLVIAFGGGVATPLLFTFVGLFLVLYSVGFTTMVKRLHRAGAFYTFVSIGLGKSLGLSAAFLAIVSYTIGALGGISFVGILVDGLIVELGGQQTPWWVWATAVAIGIAVLSYFRIDLSAKVLGIVVVVESIFIVIFNFAVVSNIDSMPTMSYESFNPTMIVPGGAVIALLYVFIAFGGFESTAIYRDEVVNPTRTVPRATYLSVTILAVFYSVGSWLLIVGLGGAEGIATVVDPSVVYLGVAGDLMGPVYFQLGSILLVTSTIASVASLVNILARYIHNLGYDGILPRSLGIPHPRWGSPHRASTLVSIVVLVGIGLAATTGASALKLYSTFSGLAGFTLVSLLLLAAIAIAVYLSKSADLNPWMRWVAPISTVAIMLVLEILVIQNIDLLTGNPTLSIASLLLPPVTVTLGVIVGVTLRSKKPEIYARIGTRE